MQSSRLLDIGMLNFVVCEDNNLVREIITNIINRVLITSDLDYKISSFEKYNNKLKSIIHNSSDIKIYILDLELPGKTGIDIVNEIRTIDWDSIVIISTSHDELEMNLLKQKLLILDFISKFDNYEKRLSDTINMVIKKLNVKKLLSFKSNKEMHRVNYNDILYVYKDSKTQLVKIVTTDQEYIVKESLVSIINRVDNRFIRTHRACFVNKDKIESVDFKNNTICFNNIKIDYLSRKYKKEMRNIL